MQSEIISPFESLSLRADVCIADGFGIKVSVNRRHLVIQDGVGRHRRERAFARATVKFKRLILLGHEGFVTLEALRWLADLGIAFIQIDHDGKLIGTSVPPGNDDARLRRSQSLARDTEAGLEIARWVLDRKLAGQRDVLVHLRAAEAGAAVEVARRSLAQAQSTEDLMSTPEARAAATYWEAWGHLPVRFVGADRKKVPDHWVTFGSRRSSLSGSPRLALNPANAILNYLYRLLEAETRIACLTVGLDPGLGFFHTDKRGRDNLVMDLMEAGRPQVDAYVMRMFEGRLFRASDFYETRKGVCRVLAPLSHELAETSGTWARFAGPVAEAVARMLGKPRRIRRERSLTPLTGANRSRVRDGVIKGKAGDLITSGIPNRRLCRLCGGEVRSRTRQYCDRCIADEGGRDTALRKAASSTQVQQALAEWRKHSLGKEDPAIFFQEILPVLQGVPVPRIMEATGLSEAYCYRIRRGEVTPHPRHWPALQHVAAQRGTS